jgi:hypothetical protein
MYFIAKKAVFFRKVTGSNKSKDHLASEVNAGAIWPFPV